MDFLQMVQNHEAHTLAVDFDGVIHKNSKGFHDGTVYDDPIEGVYDALHLLAQSYRLVVFSAKARTDRPLINGKTGVELIWEWLELHNLKQYISDVVSEKPRALYYIDDKAICFTNWSEVLNKINKSK